MNETSQQTRASDPRQYRQRPEVSDLYAPPQGGPQPDPDIRSFAERWGLHPFVGGGMLAADYMCFTLFEAPSMEFLFVLSAMVGFLLVLPCALIQKYSYNDNWGAAWGKAMLVGLLTAIPTPLPSFLTGAWAVMGFIGMRERGKRLSNGVAGHDGHVNSHGEEN
jgi:hypothetical protein